MEINFYQSDETLHKIIATICLKLINDDKKIVIYNQSQEIINYLDDSLWQFPKLKFIPHATYQDNNKEKQPIYITNNQENPNQASHLILINQIADLNFIQNFQKTFYFFNSNDINLAKENWQNWQNNNLKLNYFKKQQDKWLNLPQI